MQAKTALHVALEADDLESARLLLRAGADPSLGNKEIGARNAPLHDAARRGDAAAVSLLLEHGVHPDVVGKDGWTALCLAARCGSVPVTTRLLQAGASPAHKMPSGKSARDIALVNQKTAVIALLDAACGQ